VIPVSANFKTRRKSGVFGIDRTVELFLPVPPIDGATASSSAANFPVSAIIDGDRTALNAGAATGLYPPPAGPENFIGGGEWKAAGAVPQSVTIQTAGALVGRVLIFTHPTEGGIKTFKLQTASLIGGPYTDVATILRAEAWEKYNGRSTVVIAAPSITVTPTNLNRASIPSVIDVVLTANLTPNFWRVLVTDAGPFAEAAGDGFARMVEIELYQRQDVTSVMSKVEISHGTDVRQNSVTARQLKATFSNAALTVTPASFRRAASGQTSIDMMPEMIVRVGIDGELVTLGRMSLDGSAFDHGKRSVELDGRARNERPMFDRTAQAYRRSLRLDDASALVFTLSNLPEGLTAIENDIQELNVFAPGDKTRTELESVRKAAHDRGVYVDTDGVLRSLAGTVYSAVLPGANSINGLGSLLIDSIWFDVTNDRTLNFLYEHDGLPTAKDRIIQWDTKKNFSTRTALVNVFAIDNTVIPNVMARRPATNDFWFLSGFGTDANAKLAGWTIAGGVAVALGGNHAIAHLALSAAFVGNVLYWSECSANVDPDVIVVAAGAGVLKKWDVTTPFAPVLVGNEAARIRGMAAIGTDLYYALDDMTMVKFPTGGAFAARTNLGGPIFPTFTLAGVPPPNPGVTARRLIADGTNLWATGETTGAPLGAPTVQIATGALVMKWDTTAAFATRTFIANSKQVPGAALAIRNGVAFVHVWEKTFSASLGFIGPMLVQSWDGTGGAADVTVCFTTDNTGFNFVPGRTLVFSATGWYGKFPFVVFQHLALPSSSKSQGFIDWVLFQDTSAAQDSVATNLVHDLKENTSYELGGATAVINAVVGSVTDYTELAGQTVFTSAITVVSFSNLDATADPLTIAPIGSIQRRHARIPKLNMSAGASVNATIASGEQSAFLMILPALSTDDPDLLAKVDASSPYATNIGVARTLANRILNEGQAALRWIQVEMVLFPEVEVADLLSFNISQPTNIVPFTLVGTFRVVHVTHTIGASGDAADSKTVLELVSV